MLTATTLPALRAKVAEVLGHTLKGITVIDGFCREQFFSVLERPLLSLRVQEINTKPLGLGDELGGSRGLNSWQDTRGECAEVVLTLEIYIPLADETLDEKSLFSSIYQSLFDCTYAEFSKFHCGELVVAEQAQCFLLPITVVGNVLLVQTAETALIRDIVLKTPTTKRNQKEVQ